MRCAIAELVAKGRTAVLQTAIDAASLLRALMNRRARGPHSLVGIGVTPEFIRHTPRRSKPQRINAWQSQRMESFQCIRSPRGCSLLDQAVTACGLNASPLASMAQIRRAFLAAMATTARK